MRPIICAIFIILFSIIGFCISSGGFVLGILVGVIGYAMMMRRPD
jgi:hypothetical protein